MSLLLKESEILAAKFRCFHKLAYSQNWAFIRLQHYSKVCVLYKGYSMLGD